MGAYNYRTIPYAVALFVELLETAPDEFVVHIAMRNKSTEDEVVTLTIEGR